MGFRNNLILSCFLCLHCACLQASKSWEMKEIVSISFSGKMVAVIGASVGGRKSVPAKENKEVLELWYPLLLVMMDLLLISLLTCIHTHHAYTISSLHSLSEGILLCGIGTITIAFQEVGEGVSEKHWFFFMYFRNCGLRTGVYDLQSSFFFSLKSKMKFSLNRCLDTFSLMKFWQNPYLLVDFYFIWGFYAEC